jgi:leucyl/phenylalanyl-tRNA--protein transferase
MDIRAISESLTADMVVERYAQGMFPMANPGWGGLITWHRPDTRAIIPLDGFHISRSLAHTIKRGGFQVTFDQAFDKVMDGCADRGDDDETWITDDIKRVYGELHRRGQAHSVEVWVDGELGGGTYGVHLGAVFFAESKFHRVRDMSKVALASLVDRLRSRGFRLLEVQYLTPHLERLGAVEVSNREYRKLLREALSIRCPFGMPQ